MKPIAIKLAAPVMILMGGAMLGAIIAIWQGSVPGGLSQWVIAWFSNSASHFMSTDPEGRLIRVSYAPLGVALSGVVVVALAAALVMGCVNVWGLGADTSAAEAVRADRQKLEKELATILDLIRGHLKDNAKFALSLSGADASLRRPSISPEEVRKMVEKLLIDNDRMRQQSAVLRSQFEESQSQISVLQSTLANAQDASNRDGQTGLLNRRAFDATLTKEIGAAQAEGTNLAVIMADIDHFKRVNDTYGHPVGDEVIKAFAALLELNVKGRDIVARYGGEEFAIILPDTSLEDAQRLANRIRADFAAKELVVTATGQPVGQITASFGCGALIKGDTARALIWRTDTQLYEAKSKGRNRVV